MLQDSQFGEGIGDDTLSRGIDIKTNLPTQILYINTAAKIVLDINNQSKKKISRLRFNLYALYKLHGRYGSEDSTLEKKQLVWKHTQKLSVKKRER